MGDEQRHFKGFWIPKRIAEAEDLTWMERALLAEVDSLDDGTGCWATNAFLAKRLQTTSQVIANMFSDLRKKGYIIDRGSSKEGRYRRSVRFSSSGDHVDVTQGGSPVGEGGVNPQVKGSVGIGIGIGNRENSRDTSSGSVEAGDLFDKQTMESTINRFTSPAMRPEGGGAGDEVGRRDDGHGGAPARPRLDRGKIHDIVTTWNELTGGHINHGVVGRVLRPVLMERPLDEVKDALKVFVAQFSGAETKYITLQKFAMMYGQFAKKGGVSKWEQKTTTDA